MKMAEEFGPLFPQGKHAEAAGPCLQPSSALAIVAIWNMNQWM